MTPTSKSLVTISLTDLEMLIRRAVREVVREELAHLSHVAPATPSILDDWSHEGPDDSAGDQELLAEALLMSQKYKENQEGWQDWASFKVDMTLYHQRNPYDQPIK